MQDTVLQNHLFYDLPIPGDHQSLCLRSYEVRSETADSQTLGGALVTSAFRLLHLVTYIHQKVPAGIVVVVTVLSPQVDSYPHPRPRSKVIVEFAVA